MILNPKPQSLNPEPLNFNSTLKPNPNPQPPNLKPQTLNPEPRTGQRRSHVLPEHGLSSSLLLSRLELSDTNVYEPQIRALLGTGQRRSHVS